MKEQSTTKRPRWMATVLSYASSAALTAGLAVSLGSLGCRTEHLGANAGRAYKNALAEQHSAKRKSEPMGISATDARAVLRAHAGKTSTNTKAAPTGLAAALSGGGLSGSAGGAGGSGGSWPGASGNISLEAK